ncbi:MAG: fibrobacter succinogenes major paralogous domain-containing protein [Bacteroidales bacterium]|nr:fibrobacter succinogenes major paralogous domain-containing protein [Bacteroidales bacterium]
MRHSQFVVSILFIMCSYCVFAQEAVDLGLSVKWATCNVGANTPEEYGNYYAWGEIEPKTIYDWSTYKYFNVTSRTITKYCTDSTYGTVDKKTTLEKSDDVGYTTNGGNWRMPTSEEWNELREKCTWTWTQKNGVNGYEIKATNGNSIFLPATGYQYGSGVKYMGSYGYYWSSSANGYSNADYLYFYSGYANVNDYYRSSGLSVRLVQDVK